MATLAPTSPLRGRAVELRTLVDALGRAAGGRPAIVVVEGEAGIGKSRLLAEALEAARERGLEVVAGRGQDLERNRPFALLAGSLGCSRSSSDPRRAAIAALLATHDGDRGVATVSSDPGLQFQAVDAFLERVEALALRGPLVLGLDDLQWADPSSLLTLGCWPGGSPAARWRCWPACGRCPGGGAGADAGGPRRRRGAPPDPGPARPRRRGRAGGRGRRRRARAQAHDRGDREAVAWLTRAATEAARRSPAVAAELLERAIGLADPADPGRDRLLVDRAGALMWAGRLPEAEAAFGSLLDREHDLSVEAQARVLLARTLGTQGRLRDTLRELERVQRSPTLGEELRAGAAAAEAMARLQLGDLDGAVAAAEQARSVALPGDHPAVILATTSLAIVEELRANLGRAREIVMRNLLALASGVRRTICWNLAPEIPGYENHLSVMDLLFGKLALLDYEGTELSRRHPAADTFAQVAGRLIDVDSVVRVEVPGRPSPYLFEVRRRGLDPLLVVWDQRDSFSGEDDPPVAFDWPWPEARAAAVDAFGQPQPAEVRDGRVHLEASITPLLVTAG